MHHWQHDLLKAVRPWMLSLFAPRIRPVISSPSCISTLTARQLADQSVAQGPRQWGHWLQAKRSNARSKLEGGQLHCYYYHVTTAYWYAFPSMASPGAHSSQAWVLHALSVGTWARSPEVQSTAASKGLANKLRSQRSA